MIEIFIPVLFICMNGNCEFMQAQAVNRSEAQCRASIDLQKKHMIGVAEQSNAGKLTILEGTCINARIPDPKKQT